MNNIITTAMGAVSLLQFKAPMESTFRGELERLDSSIEALSQFTKRLERIFLDSYDNRIPFDLNRLIKITNGELGMTNFDVHYEGEVVNLPGIDVAAVQVMLKELFTNAAEAQGGKGEAWISLKKINTETCHLCIWDHGKGIPQDLMDEIFTPFKSYEKRGNLVGLGLTYVGSVVHHHGWSLAVESEEGKGTKVHISIPLPTNQDS